MRQSRFREEQIIGLLKEGEAGITVAEICRKHGICEPTYYRWKAKYGGLEVSEARRLRQWEEKNRRLKRRVAEQALARWFSNRPVSFPLEPAQEKAGGDSLRAARLE